MLNARYRGSPLERANPERSGGAKPTDLSEVAGLPKGGVEVRVFPLVVVAFPLAFVLGAMAAGTAVVVHCTIAPRAVLSFQGESFQELVLPLTEFAGERLVIAVMSNAPWVLYGAAVGLTEETRVLLGTREISLPIGRITEPVAEGEKGIFRLSLVLPQDLPAEAELLLSIDIRSVPIGG